MVQLAAEEQGLALVEPESLPRNGTFWVVTSNGLTAPYPCFPGTSILPVYSIVDGIYLVDQTGGQVNPTVRRFSAQSLDAAAVSPLEVLANSVLNLIGEIQAATELRELRQMCSALGMDGPPGFDETGEGGSYTNQFTSTFVIDTNLLWLELTNVSSGTVHAQLHSGTNQFTTNQVFAIWTTTNLLAAWQVEAEVWPTCEQTSVAPFTLPMLNREMLFVRSEDWTDKDSNADGVPDWWLWKYLHTLDLNATNLDSTGLNTLGDDFTNSIDPNIIVFTAGTTNLEVVQTTVAVQLNITGGEPAYYAVLVNDTNQAGAVWQPFSGTNLTVTLGSTDGNYDVWVGLKGWPEDATETWDTDSLTFTLDRVAPVLKITNPIIANGSATVIKPYLQLQGWADKPLASLSYDISNATGLFTNLDAVMTDVAGFDAALNEYRTNYFQAYDVPLATNDNWITLRATDRAGNTATTNFNVVLDYSGATNPPTVNLIWPLDGMAVSGTNITIRGTTSDETETIQATIVNGDGTTNVVEGLVERNGMFWIENVPLNGTNQISLQATDAAGNMTTNNFTVIPSDLILTIDYTPSGDALYQPSGAVGGTVSDPAATVWVNGLEVTNYWDDGTTTYWSADNVPIVGMGTATFDVEVSTGAGGEPLQFRAMTMSGGGGGGATVNASKTVEMEPMIKITHYQFTETTLEQMFETVVQLKPQKEWRTVPQARSAR